MKMVMAEETLKQILTLGGVSGYAGVLIERTHEFQSIEGDIPADGLIRIASPAHYANYIDVHQSIREIEFDLEAQVAHKSAPNELVDAIEETLVTYRKSYPIGWETATHGTYTWVEVQAVLYDVDVSSVFFPEIDNLAYEFGLMKIMMKRLEGV